MADWKERLNQKFTKADEAKRDETTGLEKAEEDARRFYTTIAVPALEELKAELEKHGRTVSLYTSERAAEITVRYDGEEEIRLSVETQIYPNHVRAYPKYRMYEKSGRAFGVQGHFRSGSQDYGAPSITRDEIIDDFMQRYQPRR